MSNKQLESYKKFLLNRVTATSYLTDHIENYLTTEDEAVHHTFHKVMVHNWNGSEVELFEVMSEYFAVSFIPVQYTSHGEVRTFHTSNLNLILKIIKLDFLFPHARYMYNVDVLFNDKNSAECFENQVMIEDVVVGVVNGRLNEKLELDLSNFSQDPEFVQKKIHFYKLSLLANFKILMLRVGRETKALNLSNNNLSNVPGEILNFFIKGDLVSLNLSNNNIPSVAELLRVSSKIEKLWVEGNPLCEDIGPAAYVKQILMKFPRLTELDGIRINEHGVAIPFFKNYLNMADKRSKMLVEKFLTLYFTHYDATPRRNSVDMFYDANAKLSISTTFTDADEKLLPHYARVSRNIQHLSKRRIFPTNMFEGRNNIGGILATFPTTEHDPSTFTVDVPIHDKKSLILILDGTFREKTGESEYKYLRFRRSFVFNIHTRSSTTTEYHITNEMFHIYPAPKELYENSFQNPRCSNPLALFEPGREEIDSLCNVVCHLTQLKKIEAETRLRIFGWDINKTLSEFLHDLNSNKISPGRFIDDDDFSDHSSLLDEID